MPDDENLDPARVLGRATPAVNVADSPSVPAQKPVSSAGLREQIATAEASLPALTDAAAAAGLASYGAPGDVDLRATADTAMSALQAAQDELTRLRIALPAAEQQEAASGRAAADAKLMAAYQRQVEKCEKAQAAAEKASDFEFEARQNLAVEQRALDWYGEQWLEQNAAVEKLTKRLDDLEWVAGERWEKVEKLDAELAALPRSMTDVEAAEAAQRAARDAAAAERLRQLTAETDRELREIAAAHQLAYDNELVPVTPFRMFPGSWPQDWKTEQRQKPDFPSRAEHWVVAVPRRDLDKIEVGV
jgi:hypothetical protein